MVVGRPRIPTAVDIRVPAVIEHGVAGLVAGACSGTLVHRNGVGVDVLFLDLAETVEGGVLRRIGRDTEGGLATLASGLPSLGGGGHGGVERGELAHHAFVLVLLVGMHGLGMLAQIVETRKLF